MSIRRILVGLAATVAVSAFVSTALAAKPPSGGGGTGGGTIYFRVGSLLWTMNSDGSGKTALPAGVGTEPSSLLHGGHRWFLTTQEVGGTNPDGTPHWEWFALRDDGFGGVQLTNDPAMKHGYDGVWAKDDSFFSYAAVDWVSPTAPISRIARVALSFDAAGVPAVSGSSISIVTGGVETDGNGHVSAKVWWHDWSPDGAKIAWSDKSGFAGSWLLKATTVASGATITLATGSTPSWSNDGATIVFGGTTGIESIGPTGAGRKTLVRDGTSYNVATPVWSPTGSHIAYRVSGSQPGTSFDVFRATSAGASKTDLTADVADQAMIVAWR